MRMTWDRTAQMGYIYMTDQVPERGVASSHIFDPDDGPTLVVDLDREGRLVGIEVFHPERWLPKQALDQAEIIG